MREIASVILGEPRFSESVEEPTSEQSTKANWKELTMSASTTALKPQMGQAAEPDPFDLDIRVIESGDAAAILINLTDDGCGSTCPNACATSMG
jgi:FxLD family lantipeptide